MRVTLNWWRVCFPVLLLIYPLASFCLPSLAPTAMASECTDYAKYLRWIGSGHVANSASRVALDWPHAFMPYGVKPGEENGMQVIDVTDATAPIVVGDLATYEAANDVAVSGDFAFLTTSLDSTGALAVIDVSKPSRPVIAANVPTPFGARFVALSGNHAFVTTFSQEGGTLEIIDITLPEAAFTVASVGLSWCAGLAVQDGYAYVTDNLEGLWVVDVAEPGEPLVVGHAELGYGSSDVVVRDGYAYVANQFYGGLAVVDVSDPSNPTLVTTVEADCCAFGLDVAGDYLYLAVNFDGLHVFDLSTPDDPIDVGCYLLDVTFDVTILGDRAYVAGGYTPGLEIFDITHTALPGTLGSALTEDFALDVAVEGTIACIADRAGGLHVADVADPWDPVVLGSVGVPDDALDVVMAGGMAYVIDRTAGLLLVDVTMPSSPSISATLETPGLAKAVAVRSGLAYIADWYDFCIADVCVPEVPQIIGLISGLDHVYDVEVSGDYAYLGVWGSGLLVVDVSDPTQPLLVAQIELPGIPEGVAICGSTVYVADWKSGVHIVDVSNPLAPIHTMSVPTTYRSRDVEVADGFAYVVYTKGIQVLDVTSPPEPVIVGQMPVEVYGAAVSGEFIYFAHGLAGLGITRAQCAVSAANPPEGEASPPLHLARPWPNPSGGEVALRYHVPTSCDIRLQVCDPMGRRVRLLSSGAAGPGFHLVTWDGAGDDGRMVGNGLYFIRLESAGRVQTAPLVRIR